MTRQCPIGLSLVLAFLLWLTEYAQLSAEEPDTLPIRVLIIDGQNNHDWQSTTPILKRILELTARFQVDVATSPPTGEPMQRFHPRFSDYQVVLSNYNGEAWLPETQAEFDAFVRGGGGFVCVHAANNSFPEWLEYNQMIGLGGWGGRTESAGPYVYFDRDQQLVRDSSPGPGGSHGPQREFEIVIRDPQHPITRGLPRVFLHTRDELYDRLRGPAHAMHVLATAFASEQQGGRDLHEPILMTVEYGRGRVFHTALGHADYSIKCVGFVTLLQRGTEWASTGQVTIPVPDDFPTATSTKSLELSLLDGYSGARHD